MYCRSLMGVYELFCDAVYAAMGDIFMSGIFHFSNATVSFPARAAASSLAPRYNNF